MHPLSNCRSAMCGPSFQLSKNTGVGGGGGGRAVDVKSLDVFSERPLTQSVMADSFGWHYPPALRFPTFPVPP